MFPRAPLISLELEQRTQPLSPISDNSDVYDAEPRRFYHYLPLCVTVLLILSPHPSLFIVLVNYHLMTLHSPLKFGVHLFLTYMLTSLALSSLIVCIARNPGPVNGHEMSPSHDSDSENTEMDLTEALLASSNDSSSFPERWCRKCAAPKPERTHHCSHCGRCILKMDHHCPWMASRCIGHRTYPAFLHFLTSITLLALYILIISIPALMFAFTNPHDIDETTPLHELFLSAEGFVFTLVIGSFLAYHIYLVSTNQTTLEHLSPFLLLRHLPPLPPSQQVPRLSDPPLEHELSYDQRHVVRHAHGYIRMYDVGWRKNWSQVFGWDRKWGWVDRLMRGGSSRGDGRTFPRNPRADAMLARLATELVKVDKDD